MIEREVTKLTTALVEEVQRQQKKLDWPNMVPAFAEIERADGTVVFKHYESLTPGDCEQLTEQYKRSADRAVRLYGKTRSSKARVKAAKSIVYAMVYRCKYIYLMKLDPKKEPPLLGFAVEENE